MKWRRPNRDQSAAQRRIDGMIRELSRGSADDALRVAIKLGAPGGPVPASAGPHQAVKPLHREGRMAGAAQVTPAEARHATSIRDYGNHPIPASTGAGGQASGERRKSGPLVGGKRPWRVTRT